MADLVLERLSLRYGDRPALDGIDLAIPDGQLVSVLGPSGSGKTSLLRVIAGLERPASGRISAGGRDLTSVPAHQRGIGLMFQDYALFPHRDVAGNVGFGLRMAGWETRRVSQRVSEVLALVGLPGAERRAVARLSGGEQQRVALARALAPRPGVLMLDEPMGSLDRSLRERLPIELRALFERLGITVLYVTHDQEEAFAVAPRTVVLRDGRIEADGSPEDLSTSPPTAFLARFLGYRNVAPGEVRDGRARTPWGAMAVRPGTANGTGTIVIRPSAVRMSADGTIGGQVVGRRFLGDEVRLTVAIPDAPDLELDARGPGLPAIGDDVRLTIDPAGVVLTRDPGT